MGDCGIVGLRTCRCPKTESLQTLASKTRRRLSEFARSPACSLAGWRWGHGATTLQSTLYCSTGMGQWTGRGHGRFQAHCPWPLAAYSHVQPAAGRCGGRRLKLAGPHHQGTRSQELWKMEATKELSPQCYCLSPSTLSEHPLK